MHRIKKDALFLIDGSYFLYRSYYGLRPLQTSKGVQTQAIYGFCRTIKKLLDDFNPSYVALIWDSKGKTFRSELFTEYKATRQAPPSDLFLQKEKIIEIADLMELKQFSKTGYEADDIINSFVKIYKNQQIIIVSADKDLYQLLDDNKVLIFDPFKNELIDEHDFKKLKGFPSSKVSFFYSLVGDTSDNIPGVTGIGKKTAEELVKNFDSLDDLYNNLDKVKKERTIKLLKESKSDAFLSFELFSLKNIDIIDIKKEDLSFDKNNLAKALPIFINLEFASLIKELNGVNEVKNNSEGQIKQLSLFDQKNPKKDIKYNWVCNVVQSESDLDNLVYILKHADKIAIDTEATGVSPLKDELVGLSFAVDTKAAYYVPVTHKIDLSGEKQLDRSFALEKLKVVLENKKIKKLLHNTKYDQLILYNYGINIENVFFDSLIAASLLRKRDDEKINLKILSERYLNEPMVTFKEVVGKYKDFSYVPVKLASSYAAHDALQTFKLVKILSADLNKEKKLKKLFEEVEMPLSQVLYRMELFGITVNPKILKDIAGDIDKDLEHIERKISAAIDYKLNLNSPRQIEDLLFNKLKLPIMKKSQKGQRSTDQEVLLELSKIHPIPGLILKYRELSKLRSTYTEPLIAQINSKTGRIHTSFSQTMVNTGRLSSSDPNLQNIPVSEGYGIKIRSAFIAPKNKLFLSADYSQVELRVLAHMTKDNKLKEAFLADIDIHAVTASQVFDLPIEKITHDQRQMGKRINFGIIYGLTPYGLAKDLGIKPAEAKDYIEKYFNRYSGVARWIEHIIKKTEACGYTETWLGRKRYVPGIFEKNKNLYEAARRIAINSPIQGTSAEIIKMAMINIDKIIIAEKLESRIILQIHDELVLEILDQEIEFVEKMVKNEMENVVKWDIPFKVSIRKGKNWGEVSK